MAQPLFPEDIVARTSDLQQLAIVESTCDSADTHTPYPGAVHRLPIKRDLSIPLAAFRRFTKDGVPPKDTALLRMRDETSMELVPVSKLKLIDRSLLIGDVVKRSSKDSMSGVVLQTSTKCKLQPMSDVSYLGVTNFKGIIPPGRHDRTESEFSYPNGSSALLHDIPSSKLQYAESPTEEDLIIYKDWLGRVVALTASICIKLSDNCVVEIDDESAEHPNGTLGTCTIGDIVKTKKGILRRGRWVFGQYNPNTSPVGTVVSVRIISAEVDWLQKRIGSVQDQPPEVLEARELSSSDFQVYDRTRRPSARAPTSSCSTITDSEIDVRLDLRVRFKDLTGACLKYNTGSNPNRITKLDRMDHLGYDLNVFDVSSFSTDLVVQWQDLTITSEKSIDLVPEENISDEHSVWPGEVVHSLAMRPVPGEENVERPEKVGIVQSVNAMDRMAKVKWSSPSTSYVLYSKDPDQKAEGNPEFRPLAGYSLRPPEQEEEVSLYDIEAPAMLNVRRGDIVLIANPGERSTIPSDVNWLGEIVDTPLDGTFVVRLGAASEVRDVVLYREQAVVAVRSDGTDNADPWNAGEEYEDEYDSEEEDFSGEDWSLEDEMLAARYENEDGESMDEDEVENDEWESADEGNEDDDVQMQDAPEHTTPPTSHSVTPDTGERAVEKVRSNPLNAEVHPDAPEPYLVLEGAPPSDHRYLNEPQTASSAHVKRTQKEHLILRNPSTLPPGVYIRTWESRLDLLRVMIVGPTETPYENAPFVIDFHLGPTFPQEPPKAHFHSWPAHSDIGSIGRANPNLYEEGTICLSLLGTWEGDKGEGWNAARSTLLQVIVSLLGLVLVREPYYNEAGYEALKGSDGSKRSSAVYSERVFLRSKGFIITALTPPANAPGLAGLEDVIRWLYVDTRGSNLLGATIKNMEEVLQRSDGTSEPDGVNVMSRGACVSLRRALVKLQQLQAEQQA